MSEFPQIDADPDYAQQLRVGFARSEGGGVKMYRTPVDHLRIGTGDGELPSGTRTELDRITQSIGSVKNHADALPLDRDTRAAIKSGLVFAGENRTGGLGQTEMGLFTPEQFNSMVARAVGSEALAVYRRDLHELVEKDIEDLLAPLAEGDATQLEKYALYTLQKEWYQQNDDGEMSIRCSQILGDAVKKMSPEADALKNQYLSLYASKKALEAGPLSPKEPSNDSGSTELATSEHTSAQNGVERPEVDVAEQKRAIIDDIHDFRTAMRRISDSARGMPDAHQEVDSTFIRAMHDAGATVLPGETSGDIAIKLATAAGRVRSTEQVHTAMSIFTNVASEVLNNLTHQDEREEVYHFLTRVQQVGNLRFAGTQHEAQMNADAESLVDSLLVQAVDASKSKEARALLTSALLLAEGLADSPRATGLVMDKLDSILQQNIG